MNHKVASQGYEYGVKHFYAENEGNSFQIIADALNLDHALLTNLFALGSVYINQKRNTDFTASVQQGAYIRVHTKPRRYNVDFNWKERIIFEDSDFIVLNKPAGIPSHPSVDNIKENSLTQTELALNQKLYISHRLDTLTEGLIVYGKSPLFVSSFNKSLQSHLVTKKYSAIIQVAERFSEEFFKTPFPKKLIHYMEPSPKAPKKLSSFYIENGLLCELLIENATSYKWGDLSDLKKIQINLLTGRTHQIRSQLGCTGGIETPILGDALYGSTIQWKPTTAIALKAFYIEFPYQNKLHRYELNDDFSEEDN